MWDFCVRTSIDSKHLIDFIDEKLSNNNFHFKFARCTTERNGFCDLTIACPKGFSNILKEKLKKILCDTICEKMKYDYFSKNISVQFEKENLFKAFTKVYTYFDIELEKAITIRAIYFPNVLNLDGFLNFRLNPLKQKWKEMCQLTNMSSKVFLENDSFLELLKFLIKNLDYKQKVLIIDFSDDCKFFDEKNSLLKVQKNIDLLEVLQAIIEFSPKTLKIIDRTDNKQIVSALCDLFFGRVELTKS